jgi:hypothetical protein
MPWPSAAAGTKEQQKWGRRRVSARVERSWSSRRARWEVKEQERLQRRPLPLFLLGDGLDIDSSTGREDQDEDD